ncbi:MAG: 4Fe-4S binding protein [bacterium]|nr:4Fe-4S binding protein [bacterium]
MRSTFWIWLRRISQILFFLFFGALIFTAIYPLELPLPYELPGKLSPLVATVTMLADRAFIGAFWPVLIVLALSVVFGRAFCGWVCPLGVTIDFADWLTRKIPFLKRRKEPNKPRARFWRFVILFVIVIFALFGIQIAGYFDPMSLFPRSFGVGIYPLIISGVEVVTRFLYMNDVLPDVMFTFRQYLLVEETGSLTFDLSFLLIFLGILALGFIRPRFYCRYLCPTGALISVFGWLSPFGRRVDEECSSCRVCLHRCRTGAMAERGAGTQMTECILCMDCLRDCKTGRNSFGFGKKRTESNPTAWAPTVSRKAFLISSGAGLVTAAPAMFALGKEKEIGNLVRPPGALGESDFLDRCIRCGQCMKVCITGGLIPAGFEGGVEGIWSPRFNMRKGYCEYHCTLCTQVCPTEAIERLDEESKIRTVIGFAEIDEDTCLPFAEKKECSVCEEFCPTSPKAIELRECKPQGKGRGRRYGKQVLEPRVIEENCVGCGICEYVCPLEKSAIVVYPRRGYLPHLVGGPPGEKPYRGEIPSSDYGKDDDPYGVY